MARHDFKEEHIDASVNKYVILCLFDLFVTFVAMFFVPVGVVISCIALLAAVINWFMCMMFLFRSQLRPLTKMYELFTGHSPYSISKDDYGRGYADYFQFIVFGIFGRALFWIIVFVFATTLFFYRAHEDGFIVGDYTYEAGEQVVYKIAGSRARHIGSVVTKNEDGTYQVRSLEGEETLETPSQIKGLYIPYEADGLWKEIKIFTRSAIGGVERLIGNGIYLKDKIAREVLE